MLSGKNKYRIEEKIGKFGKLFKIFKTLFQKDYEVLVKKLEKEATGDTTEVQYKDAWHKISNLGKYKLLRQVQLGTFIPKVTFFVNIAA